MSENTHQGSSDRSGRQYLYPPRAIEIADAVTHAIREGGKVYVSGDGADAFVERISIRCNYDRPKVGNIAVGEDYDTSVGDVLIVIDGNDSMVAHGVTEIHITTDIAEIVPAIVERSLFGKRAVFFDRDDTINDDVGHCRRPEDIKIFPGVGEAMKKLNDAGLMTIMITNQSVIGRGWLDEKGLEIIHDKVRKDVLPGRIDDIFYCPHVPDGGCDCRKPKIGMAIQALRKYNIDTLNSYMIGDGDRDVQFGESIGCKAYKVSDEYTFVDAVNDILEDLGTE